MGVEKFNSICSAVFREAITLESNHYITEINTVNYLINKSLAIWNNVALFVFHPKIHCYK